MTPQALMDESQALSLARVENADIGGGKVYVEVRDKNRADLIARPGLLYPAGISYFVPTETQYIVKTDG